MDPQTVRFACPNLDCPARGQLGKDNIRLHSRKEGRYRCQVCGRTFAARRGTTFYRLRTADETVTRVITLLAYGCPMAGIVQAFGLDERTVRAWWQRAGQHCRAVHEQVVAAQQLDLQQVQADEIRVKTQNGVYWMALAIMVSTRLWLGGVVSARRDGDLIAALVQQVRQMARCRPLLLAVDGLNTYVNAFQRAFRSPLPRQGASGRSHRVAWPDIMIVQVVKQRLAGVLTIDRRIVQGQADQIDRLIQQTQGAGGINTAYIERLNATFRQRLSVLVRRTRALARRPETLTTGMYVLGTLYNLCTFHHSLRLKLSVGSHGHHWVKRTPALAAGLTDHRWSVQELLTYRVPPTPWRPHPGRQGRWSKATHALVERWAT
jgi:transposase-like protein